MDSGALWHYSVLWLLLNPGTWSDHDLATVVSQSSPDCTSEQSKGQADRSVACGYLSIHRIGPSYRCNLSKSSLSVLVSHSLTLVHFLALDSARDNHSLGYVAIATVGSSIKANDSYLSSSSSGSRTN